jgi:hypothetical protein
MRKLTAVVALALTSLAACSDDDGTNPIPQGRVRVVHAIPNLGAADVLFGADLKKADLAYKGVYENASTPAGNVTVKFRKADATADLVSVAQAVTSGRSYTIVALGTQAAPQSLVLTDDVAAPAAGKARVRVAHAAASQGAVDVYVLEDADDLATATPAKANLAMKAASDYVTVDAGAHVVVLTTPGTKTALLTVPNVPLTAGKVLTVIATEKAAGGAPLESVTLTDR